MNPRTSTSLEKPLISVLGSALLAIAAHKARQTLIRAATAAGVPPVGRGVIVRADKRYRTLLAPHEPDAAEFHVGAFYVCTHGDHWGAQDWRVSTEEIPLTTKALSTPTSVTWPAPEAWDLWLPLAAHPRLEGALDILRDFAVHGHWEHGSYLPDLLAAEGTATAPEQFWELLRILARDGAPPDVAVSTASRL